MNNRVYSYIIFIACVLGCIGGEINPPTTTTLFVENDSGGGEQEEAGWISPKDLRSTYESGEMLECIFELQGGEGDCIFRKNKYFMHVETLGLGGYTAFNGTWYFEWSSLDEQVTKASIDELTSREKRRLDSFNILDYLNENVEDLKCRPINDSDDVFTPEPIG